MNLTIKRNTLTDKFTESCMFVDGLYFCDILEDPYRNGPKIPGNTCIPFGVYPVVLSKSVRFGRIMPEIQNVPGFSGVRFHAGNDVKDTEGCPLLGIRDKPGHLDQSKVTFNKFMEVLSYALNVKKETCELEII